MAGGEISEANCLPIRITALIDVPVNTTFDYVTGLPLQTGNRIWVPFGRKRVLGVVDKLSGGWRGEAKEVIRLLDEGGRWYSERDIAYLKECADAFWVGPGEMVIAGLPRELRAGRWDRFIPDDLRGRGGRPTVRSVSASLAQFRQEALERISQGNWCQVLWITDNKERARELGQLLRQRFPDREVFVFYQGIGKSLLKGIIEGLSRAPAILIGTRQLAFWPIVSPELVLLELAWLDIHRQEVTPKYSLVKALEIRARHSGGEFWFHGVSPNPDCEIIGVDARAHPLIPAFVEEEIKKVSAGGGRSAIFLLGKGYAKLLRCSACKEVLRCERCDRPYMLIRREGADRLFCPACNATILWDGRCLKCGSLSVRLSSMGAERWEQIIRKRLMGTVDVLHHWQGIDSNYDVGLLLGIDNVLGVDKFYSPRLAVDFIASASHHCRRLYVRTRFPEIAEVDSYLKRYDETLRKAHLPPYGELVCISIRAPRSSEALEKAQRLHKEIADLIKAHPGSTCQVYGPYQPVEKKKRDRYYWSLDLQMAEGDPSLRKKLLDCILRFRKRHNAITTVEVYS